MARRVRVLSRSRPIDSVVTFLACPVIHHVPGDPMPRLVRSLALIVAASACSKSENAATDSTTAKADSTPAAPAMFASAGATDSMKTPESVRYDADVDAYFVSNINGNPSAKAGNGFNARIAA